MKKILVLAVAISLISTIWILLGFFLKEPEKETRHWFFEESLQTGRAVVLKNAYLFRIEGEDFVFIYEGKEYRVRGKVPADCIGVCDIEVDQEEVKKISRKPERMEGTLQAYDGQKLSLLGEEAVELLMEDEKVPIYRLSEEGVLAADWEELIVGSTKVDCIMDRGKVCCILIEEEGAETIRVLIKNKESIFYPNLYLKKASESGVIDIKEYLEANQVREASFFDPIGIYLCSDPEGTTAGLMYEGRMRILQEEEGYVLVNELPIETYLKYVLPSEMPRTFQKEALKAQAVCARTFAYAHLTNQSYAKYGANLDDSTHFQVYHATGRSNETDAAVEETKQEVLTYENRLIVCYYFSTSAGHTNDCSVWGSSTPEYISLTESPDENSPFYRWTAELDASKGLRLQILETNPSSYVTKLSLGNGDEEKIFTNENEIRKELGQYLTKVLLSDGTIRTDLSMIPSASFSIEETGDGRLLLHGAGFGHGIGLSQYGANRMAEAGEDYQSILMHYFPKVRIVAHKKES